MNFTKLVKVLRRITSTHHEQNSIGEVQFYSDFAHALHEFFQDSLGKDYLFSFPFVSEKGIPMNPSREYLVSDRLPENERTAIETHLKNGEERLKAGECLSITKLMIENLFANDEVQSLLIKRIRSEYSRQKLERLSEYEDEFLGIDITKNFRTSAGYFTSDFKNIAGYLKVEKADYERLHNRFDTFVKLPAADHLVYLIKPYSTHQEFNVVLVLGVKVPLIANAFHLLRLLIYRFVSEVAIKKVEEVEELRRKKSFSLTTHALKTTVNTSIKPKVGNIIDEISKIPLLVNSTLNKHVHDLDRRTSDLFCMASFITLIDKVKDRDAFIRSGMQDGLLVERVEELDIGERCENYNNDNKRFDDIVIPDKNLPGFSMMVYDVFFSTVALQNFLNTLFENVHRYGKRNEQINVELRISKDSSVWTFENDEVEPTYMDPSKLTGNLLLFQVLIEDTGSGRLTIDPYEGTFKVSYETHT